MFQRLAVDRGAILFDPERVDDPGWELFDRARWQARGALTAHLDRLARSLAKITAGRIEWQAGFAVLRSAHDG